MVIPSECGHVLGGPLAPLAGLGEAAQPAEEEEEQEEDPEPVVPVQAEHGAAGDQHRRVWAGW